MEKQYDLPPYTMEELNARIDEAEEQIARGEVFSHEEVMAEMRDVSTRTAFSR